MVSHLLELIDNETDYQTLEEETPTFIEYLKHLDLLHRLTFHKTI